MSELSTLRRWPVPRSTSCIWTNKQGMDAVTEARDQGLSDFRGDLPAVPCILPARRLQGWYSGTRILRARDFVCSPPMKGKESQDALWEWHQARRLFQLWQQTTARSLKAEKDWGITQKDGTPGNFTTIPNGCAGIENMYPYILSEANKGRISFDKGCTDCPLQTLLSCSVSIYLQGRYRRLVLTQISLSTILRRNSLLRTQKTSTVLLTTLFGRNPSSRDIQLQLTPEVSWYSTAKTTLAKAATVSSLNVRKLNSRALNSKPEYKVLHRTFPKNGDPHCGSPFFI